MGVDKARSEAELTQSQLRHKAMDLLARREHAVAELVQKLISKGHPAEQVQAVVAELQGDGLVSDARFTEAFIRNRTQRGYGPTRIQAELRERGVGEDIQAAYLDFSDPQWIEYSAQVRRKRFGGGVPADFKERARQMRFLQYRGFTGEQIRRVLAEEDDS